MTLKFAYKFCLIFLVTIAVNIFGEEPTKRFGCHNLSSVDKITSLGNDELLEKLTQCMKNTDTHNEENLETAKKLQNDFESAQKDTGYNLWKKRFASKKGVSGIFAGGFILFCVSMANNHPALGGIITAIGAPLLVAYNDKQAQLVDIQKRERKEAIAQDIKDFVDTLQKTTEKK